MHAAFPLIFGIVATQGSLVSPDLNAEEHVYFQTWYLNEYKLSVIDTVINRKPGIVKNVQISDHLIILHELRKYGKTNNKQTLSKLRSFFGDSYSVDIEDENRDIARQIVMMKDIHEVLLADRSRMSAKTLEDILKFLYPNTVIKEKHIDIWKRYCIEPLVRNEQPAPYTPFGEHKWKLSSDSIQLYLKELLLDEFDRLNPNFSL